MNALNLQDNRKILWMFDFSGNTVTSELSRYLMFKPNYQVLKPAGTRDICGVLESRCDGSAFDLPRSVTKRNDVSPLLESYKEKFLY